MSFLWNGVIYIFFYIFYVVVVVAFLFPCSGVLAERVSFDLIRTYHIIPHDFWRVDVEWKFFVFVFWGEI